MAVLTVCDAPSCDAVQRPKRDEAWPWYSAVIQLSAPQEACDDGDCDGGGHHWTWEQSGVRVDACSLEHMRSALAMKIADLTDEHAS